MELETQSEISKLESETKILFKTTAQNVLKMGENLCRLKELVGHGNFVGYIEKTFPFHKTHANNFMNTFRKFGHIKNNSFFESTVLIKLSSAKIPDGVVSKAIEKAESGEKVTTKDVDEWKNDETKQVIDIEIKESEQPEETDTAQDKDIILDLENGVEFNIEPELDKLPKTLTKNQKHRLVILAEQYENIADFLINFAHGKNPEYIYISREGRLSDSNSEKENKNSGSPNIKSSVKTSPQINKSFLSLHESNLLIKELMDSVNENCPMFKKFSSKTETWKKWQVSFNALSVYHQSRYDIISPVIEFVKRHKNPKFSWGTAIRDPDGLSKNFVLIHAQWLKTAQTQTALNSKFDGKIDKSVYDG